MKNSLLLLFFVAVYAMIIGESSQAWYLNPKVCSPEMFSQEVDKKELDMCWVFSQGSHFRFVSTNESIYFEIALGEIPDRYLNFFERQKDKFIDYKAKELQQIVFSYELRSNGDEKVNQPRFAKNDENRGEYSYILTDRRLFQDANPTVINQDDLESIIRKSNVLFYTGAGLSRASNIPTMCELHQLLGLKVDGQFLDSLEAALERPQEFALKIQMFHQACIQNPPTPAHKAIKELAFFKNTLVITENLDCLHEASGICPYRINAKHMRETVNNKDLADIDYIICVGLSHDDRGFLGWYKENNPNGIIVAIDLSQPSYLGCEDFFLPGDLQDVTVVMRDKFIEH